MNSKVAKKIRQQHRRTQSETVQMVNEAMPKVATRALLEIRQWPLVDRLKFAWWLLAGRGEWQGV
jgi:hypothetical protein